MARSAFGKVLGWGLLIGGGAGLLSLFSRKAGAQTLATHMALPVRSEVETRFQWKRATRVVWRGRDPWATLQPPPKFRVGDRVTIHNPPAPGVEPDVLTEGKTAAVVELVCNEVVDIAPDGAQTPVAGAPGRWTYVLDLKLGDPPLPVEVAETSLMPAAAAAPAPVVRPTLTVVPPPAPGPVSAAVLERHTAPSPAPAHPAPLYPMDMTAQLGRYTGTVKQAWFDLGHWNYRIDVSNIPVVGTYQWSGSEDEAKAEIAKRTGQPAGPAYVRGGTFLRNGKGGEVTEVTGDAASGYKYQLKGWPNPITEAEFAAVLGNA